MPLKKFSIIAISMVLLLALTGNHIIGLAYTEEFNRCCDFSCQCSKSFGDLCSKKLHFQKSSCNFEYKQSLEIQATLPKSVSNEDRGFEENQVYGIAIIPPSIKILFNSINYYLAYLENKQILFICTGWFQYRAPPLS